MYSVFTQTKWAFEGGSDSGVFAYVHEMADPTAIAAVSQPSLQSAAQGVSRLGHVHTSAQSMSVFVSAASQVPAFALIPSALQLNDPATAVTISC